MLTRAPGWQPQAVIFDMDGTLFDTETLYFAAEAALLARRGHQLSHAVVEQVIGLPGLVAITRLAEVFGLKESPRDLLAETQSIFRSLFAEHTAAGRTITMPGVDEIFAALEAASIPKGLATSTDRPLTTYLLTNTGYWDRLFPIFTRDDVPRGKPHPDIYLEACRHLGLAPADVLVIEDSFTGLSAAKAAGCFAVAAPNSATARMDFSTADLVICGLLDPKLWSQLGLPLLTQSGGN